ncbi:NAD(P)/FAD-dependent oxidoreductase [Actinoallomurus rhizosphaericola]|uniref:NAD(P)/FAD-dependent oxidoreductase n=1 Tax=Actinoallomurus rhizosphaericola TaxID=2952536 RepID=UPI002093CD94|nr:FAD-dependent oxidoreductase [Actinoallomurus rhizosphaericola]MCO5996238.1 FAD-dependent oxidoreductase [Actinoallomurus rhizosphaericola]
MAARILVLGAGYSGLVAAQLTARHRDTRVTLVNASDRFVERVRLHQVATGQEVRTRPIAELLGGAPVEFVVGRVTAIDAAKREAELADGRRLGYDTLIYALGSRSDVESVPGAAEHARPLATADDAVRLRDRLADGGAVAVVGGGLTGVEAATELAEARPDLTVRLLTAGRLGAALSERGRRHLRRVFDRLGVEIREDARVTEVRADGVLLTGGEFVPAGTVVWTAGFRVPDLARQAGFAVDEHGRMLVDAALRSVSHPEVYGIGDAAAMHRQGGQELRMACATGLPAAQHVARAIRQGLGRRAPSPFRFRYVNQCISLGRRDALIQYVRADDSPVGLVLTGRIAALYKEAIVRGALAAQRHPALVALTPGGGPSRDRLDLAG